MEDGSKKRWFLPFWQFPGLLAKLLLTPAVSTGRALTSYLKRAPLSSCAYPVLSHNFQDWFWSYNIFACFFFLLHVFIQPSPGSCRAGPRVHKPRNPCDPTIVSAAQEVSSSIWHWPNSFLIFKQNLHYIRVCHHLSLLLRRSTHLLTLPCHHQLNLHSITQSSLNLLR